MTARLASVATWFLAACAAAATNELADAQIEGRQLAQQLREQRPVGNSSINGVLKIREARNKRVEIPVQFQTTLTATNWQTIYSTQDKNQENTASVTVIYADNQPNQYQVRTLGRPRDQTNEFVTLTGDETMIPFAGSDFSLADLGLEFFHWPGQRLLKKELKRGQSCSVLESINPAPSTNGYARVISWIDQDTGGIVQAEAYDHNGKLLKAFAPKEIKKVNGQWQLQEMEIRNVKTGSRTRIEFNLDAK